MLIDGVCYLCEGPIRGNCTLITSWIAGGCSCGILKKEQFTIYLSQASLGMNKSLSTIHVSYRMVSEDWNISQHEWEAVRHHETFVADFEGAMLSHIRQFYCNRFKLTLLTNKKGRFTQFNSPSTSDPPRLLQGQNVRVSCQPLSFRSSFTILPHSQGHLYPPGKKADWKFEHKQTASGNWK